MESKASKLIDILNEATRSISKANNDIEINSIVEAFLLNFTHSEFATFLIYNKEKQTLCMEKKDKKLEIPMRNPQGLLGNTFLSKKAEIYNHVVSQKHYLQEIDNPYANRIKGLMLVPIISKEDIVCIVSVSRYTQYKDTYTTQDVELLKSLTPFFIKISKKMLSKTKKIGNENEKTVDSETEISDEIIKIEERSVNLHKSTDEHDCADAMQLFAASVHDIRTPANSLYGFLELIESKIKDDKIRGFIENAKESASFINELTTSILDQAKQEYFDKEIKLSEENAIKFFSQIADSFSANMSNKDIEYLIYMDPKMPKKISIEAMKLKRVLINLIGNAYKFTPKGKQIAFIVIYNTDTSTITISVNDQGIGIDESRQKDIFKAYKQAEDDTIDRYGGTGLGLSICAQYVKELGGTLLLNSVLDKGSKFYFDIPVEVVDSRPSQKPFKNFDKIITILTDKKKSANVRIIKNYLTTLGMPKDRIVVSDKLHEDTTHLFCYQHKATPEILSKASNQGIKLVVIEESLFALENDAQFSGIRKMSKNTYYGDIVHKTVLAEEINRALIVDDNAINVQLLNAILENEFCEVSSVQNGDDAIKKFNEAHKEDKPFDMIFLDKYLPTISGDEVLNTIRRFESNKNVDPVYAISITGDPEQMDEESSLYNLLVKKPFKNSELEEAFLKAVKFKKER